MRFRGLWLLALAGALAGANAQVTVEVIQPQQQFLPGESIFAAARITNRSGQTLHLGAEDGWLTFNIESRDGLVVEKLGDVPVRGAFDLASSEVATKRVDLGPYFNVSQPGRYTVTATAHIKDWNRDVVSAPLGFDVVQGARLWEQEVGVPVTNGPPEVRKYVLQQVNYIKGQLRLYLRVTDTLGAKVFRVFPVGPILTFSKPEPQVDPSSNLHLLYQNGPYSSLYCIFNPDGDLMVRQTYDILNTTRPHLRADAEGKISVVGGARHVTKTDVPPPPQTGESDEDAPFANLTNSPAPAAPPAKPAKSATTK